MGENTLEELTEADVKVVKDILGKIKEINNLGEGGKIPGTTQEYAPILAERVSLELLKDPERLMDGFFDGLLMDSFRKDKGPRKDYFNECVDYMPRLAEILLPGEFADKVKEWHKKREEFYKGAYNRWHNNIYNRPPSKPKPTSYIASLPPAASAGSSIVDEEARITKLHQDKK